MCQCMAIADGTQHRNDVFTGANSFWESYPILQDSVPISRCGRALFGILLSCHFFDGQAAFTPKFNMRAMVLCKNPGLRYALGTCTVSRQRVLQWLWQQCRGTQFWSSQQTDGSVFSKSIEKMKRIPGIDRFAMPALSILNFILSESESTESLLRRILELDQWETITVSISLSLARIPKHSIPFHLRLLAKVHRYPGHSAKCCVFGFGTAKCCFCCEPWQWHRLDPRFFSLSGKIVDWNRLYCGKCFDDGM